MQETLPTDEINTAPARGEAKNKSWLERLEADGDLRGYFEPVGPNHSAILTDEGSTLLVTFERAADLRTEEGNGDPLGWSVVAENGWSHLCLLAHEDSWFRDKAVFGYFDRLVEDGFFEEFEKVVFYGAGMCGYAAAAFSVVAPDVTVIAVQPQATLDPARAEWDQRFPAMRRTSFTDRYGYAPDMVEMAEDVFIFYDPELPEDSMHASLFDGENIHRILCRRMGENIGETLEKMDVLPELIELAGASALDAQTCHEILRARRDHGPYLHRLLNRLEEDKRHLLVKALAGNVASRRHAPRFKRSLKRAEAALETELAQD